VVLRVDRAFQAFFRRVQARAGSCRLVLAGETPGYPRFHGRARFNRFTYPQYENGARLDNGFLVLAKSGPVAVRWPRPLAGTPKTVTLNREADGCSVGIACAECRYTP
jgi:putative transposase